MDIGERIKKRRLALGLSADDVAAALGKNRTTVYRYESSAIGDFPTSVLEGLSCVLHTTPAYLMGWEDDPDTKNSALSADQDEERAELLAALDKATSDFTPEEMQQVQEYVAFLRSRRK